ncbi:serine/threonine protein kinase [Nocardia sp. 2]|uniref:non-specific serine/threonine protein kinase n=2 Tax=Nocardia acididurans TaxID=2802282 RepID=A0ABS1MC60_9NOCA|nr:serine/threonine protein kinase [Nocardia acididurans]
MGAVYLAQHPRLPRQVAVKILLAGFGEDTEFRARFIREAELAGALSHPNLVAVHDRGLDGEVLWLAMQYVEGFDAAQLIAQGPGVLTPARAVYIVGEAARGLDAVHRAGLLHRDVKPGNILISPRPDGADRVLVTDFGIARPMADSHALTAAGSVLATLGYAAPEQIRAEPVDQRADVYALGCTLYQMLTGAQPFVRESPIAVMRAHLEDPPPAPSRREAGVPRQLDAVIARALAKHPADRYPSCGALAEAAYAALHGTLETPRRTGRSTARATAVAVAAAVAVLMVAAALVFGVGDDTSAHRPPDPVAPIDDSGKPWGYYTVVAETFPDMIPTTPTGSGHGDSRCYAMNEKRLAAAVDVPSSELSIHCTSTGAVPSVMYTCNASGVPRFTVTPTTPHRKEDWTRASGSGQLVWNEFTASDGTGHGMLRVYFYDSVRSPCTVTAMNDSTGAALRETWWPDARI